MNDCGECTLCCELPELHEIPSAIGVMCSKCDNGCTIHDNKPQECADYQCMWSQMDHVGLEMRPDKCGIIFDKVTNDVITARMRDGGFINKLVLGQINAFKKEGFSVLIFRGRDMKYFLNDNHTENYVLEAVHGNTIIY